MAVEPLFVVDYDSGDPLTALYTRIRLDIAVTTASTQAIVNRVVQQVRVLLYKRLTADLVTELKAIAPVENPTTTDGLRRVSAESAETLWVEYILIAALPVGVYDAIVSTPANQMFNKEPLTRDIDPDMWEERREAIWNELQELLDVLTDTGSSATNVTTIEPTDFDVAHPAGSSTVPGGNDQPYEGFDIP